MQPLATVIFDFDSTFVTVETLDELARIAVSNNPQKEEVLKKIQEITRLGMEGSIDFPTSLFRRLALFKANKAHIDLLILFLKSHITPSIFRNREFFQKNKDRIYIISGGFIEYIAPIVSDFGIAHDHILANRFTFNEKNDIIGFDTDNYLAQIGGKAKAVVSLNLNNEVHIIGDGYTDFEIREKLSTSRFYAFTENVVRPEVAKRADKVIASFDEYLT